MAGHVILPMIIRWKLFICCSQISKKRSQKSIYYNDWAVTFDGEGSWSFGIDFARNVVIFWADNSSSSHTDSQENNFLELGERQNDDINARTGAAENKLVLTLVK